MQFIILNKMGKGGYENMGWNLLPDNLLLSIFGYLDIKDLVAISEVCRHWSKVSKDNYLWKRRFNLDFKVNHRKEMSIFNGDGSWLSEYRRLIDESPSMESEILKNHTDEVLHVSFNSDGSMFATCSKDCTLKIWEMSYPCCLLHDKDMSCPFHWHYTQFSQFNYSDSLILVSGVYEGSTTGEIIIFAIKEDGLEFQSRVRNKPYDIFGCWYDEDHLINGQLQWISPMTSKSDIYVCSASQEIESEQKSVMARLYKFLNRNCSTIHTAIVSSYVSPFIRYAVQMTEKFVEAEKAGVDFDPDGNSFEVWEKENMIKESMVGDNDAGTSGKSWPDKLLIFGTGSLTLTPHQIGFKLLKGRDIGAMLDSDVMPEERLKAVMEKIRLRRDQHTNAEVPGSDASDDESMDVNVEPQIPGQDDEEIIWQQIVERYDFPDHLIELHGHIIGMALTRDERYLFVNVRPWPDGCVISDPCRPPPIAQQIETRIIDLETLTLMDIQYRSHKGFTPTEECFFIFLDACDQFVASGSEDKYAYVWDRHYGCLTMKLPHTNVVNSVAFHPKNPSILISVSDDHTIKVWRSKSIMRNMKCP